MATCTRIDAAACADGIGGHRGRTQSECVEQVRAEAVQCPASAEAMVRVAVSAGVAAKHARDVVPAAAFPERRARANRSVLHARVQSGVDVSRWIFLDR